MRRAALAHSGSPTRAAATATAGRCRLLVLIGVLLRSHRILHASGAAAQEDSDDSEWDDSEEEEEEEEEEDDDDEA